MNKEELFTSKDKRKYYSMDISMMQTDDKVINWTLNKVKMFIKPYVLNKSLAFFREASQITIILMISLMVITKEMES